jgi:divalent metal cation (Fe/Co/Zn/Cd) transporter
VLLTDIKLFDPAIAIVLALNILWTGKNLVRESVGGLMNEQDKKIIDSIAQAVDEERKINPYWIDLHKLRYWLSGDRFIIDFHLTIPFYSTIDESHNEFDRMEGLLKKKLDTADVELLMHLDPCKNYFCKICRQQSCSYRSEAQKFDAIWDGKKVIEDATFVVGEEAAANP